jgi:DNA repair ATPase RecN
MDFELFLPVIAAAISMTVGGITATDEVQHVLRKLLRKSKSTQTYSEQLAALTHNLTQSTQQVDLILSELAQVAKEREANIQALEVNLSNLEGREKHLQQRIEELQKVPLPAVEHFAKLLEPGERKSAWRDYMLFGAGVLLSTAIAIGLKFAGLG